MKDEDTQISPSEVMRDQWLRGGPSMAGYRIVETHHLPKVFSHFETVRFTAHPFICWLANWIDVESYLEAKYKRYRDGDLVVDNKRHIIYCSALQHQLMKIQARKDDNYETQGLT